MHTHQDAYKTQFPSADAMVAAANPAGTAYHTVPGTLEINAIPTLIKGLLWFAVGIVLAVALRLTLDLNIEQAIGLLLLPFVIYALIKGARTRPDAMAISNDTVWLLTDVVYNKKSDTWGYDERYEIPRSDLQKSWVLQRYQVKFKVPKQLRVSLRQHIFMQLGKHYKHNPIGTTEAKKLLWG